MILDHSPVRLENFNGVYGVDNFEESCPPDHAIDSLNMISYGNEVRTRDGIDTDLEMENVIQFVIYRRQGEAARRLVLDSDGNIYDTATDQIILTVAGMTGFAFEVYNNRAFISPHNGSAGLPGEFTYIYNGSGVARKAAGVGPAGSFTATVSANAGVIEEGSHIFAWTFETDSGFTTPPSEAQIVVFDGTKAVNFSNIPTGPAGTAARRLIASRAIQTYNGNPLAYEMFFVPNGRIPNNVNTTLSDISFFDNDLQFSADYTYDQLEEIPAVAFISPYARRACYGGPDSDKNLVYISKALEPESIHSSAGFVTCDPFESEGVKDATEFRDNLYITKGSGKTYVTRDNGSEPSTWPGPVRIDQTIGADINGIARYYDSKGAKIEFFVVADESGLFKFNGVYEEIPVSFKISKWWRRITKTAFNKLQLIFDQNKFLFYVLVPLDGETSPTHIFVGDYSNGFTFDRIKWWIWAFTEFDPTCIGVDRDVVTNKTQLKVSSLTGIYVQEESRRDDLLASINHYIKLALVPPNSGTIHHYGAISLRVKGSGNLGISLSGPDEVESQTLPSHALSLTPGKDHMQLAHFQCERASVKLSMNNNGSYFQVRQVTLYSNVVFHSRPL